MDALKRYRAKAQQTVRVERVTVREGGQAIVRSVSHEGFVTLTQLNQNSRRYPRSSSRNFEPLSE